jgi:hypothetical protein
MKVFEGFEGRPQFTLNRKRGHDGERGIEPQK